MAIPPDDEFSLSESFEQHAAEIERYFPATSEYFKSSPPNSSDAVSEAFGDKSENGQTLKHTLQVSRHSSTPSDAEKNPAFKYPIDNFLLGHNAAQAEHPQHMSARTTVFTDVKCRLSIHSSIRK